MPKGQFVRTRKSIPARFWPKVDQTDDCWVWTGAHNADGYGLFKVDGAPVYAHRLSYEMLVGPIPAGLALDHLCRNRACVRPTHLEPVADRENVLRGVGITARQARQEFCKRGHPFDEANTYNWRGARICRACRRLAAHR